MEERKKKHALKFKSKEQQNSKTNARKVGGARGKKRGGGLQKLELTLWGKGWLRLRSQMIRCRPEEYSDRRLSEEDPLLVKCRGGG